ncbi:MAG: TonB-dependent receptor [Verrucomicrobia bacterium]|nr:TonB-dependent receptor [Verrucomicrobiota bacterium]
MSTLLRFVPVLLLPALLSAQTRPGGSPPASPSTEDVVRLSEFNVSADSDRGYAPSETLTGTRVATKIIDLPYTVNVLTAEFFEDFGIFELADNIVHIGSFTGLDIGGNFNLRGFSSSFQLRDGFFRLGRYGSSNIDRMEIIKGSNAAIYGRSSPGGMVNMVSKAPKTRESQKVTFNYGDYGTERVTLEATGPLLSSSLGKTSYIVTASHYQRDFGQEFARNRNYEYYAAIKHTFPDASNLLVAAEYLLQMRHAPLNAAPLVTDQKGTASNLDDEAVGYAWGLANYNPFGPNSELNRGYSGMTANYDKRLNEVWSVRASGNYYLVRRWDYNQNTGWGGITINPSSATAAVQSARGANPQKGLIFEDGGGFQGDVLAHYWTNNRRIEHRTLATLDINDYYRWDPTRQFAGATNPDIVAWNAVRTVRLNPATLEPLGAVAYFPKWFQWGQEVATRIRKQRVTVLGGLLRHQAALFDGRLLAYAGARNDTVRFRHRDFTAPPAGYAPGQMLDRRMSALKPNFGVNYKLTSHLRVFANYSESYFVPQSEATATVAEADYRSEVASGYDYGFKGSYLNDRLNFTVSGFYATRENVLVTELEETPPGSGNYLTVSRRDGNQLVRGFELDVNWRATDTVSVGGSWGHIYSIYTDFGAAFPLAVGRRVQGISPQNGGAYLKWAPASGWAKGLSGNLGFTHVASTPTEAPNAGDTYTTTPTGQRALQRTTYQWRLRVPSYTLWNLGLRYRLPARSTRLDHTLAINVNNLFDLDYVRANRLLGEKRSIFFTYTLGRTGSRR